jgi:hypothetical protein
VTRRRHGGAPPPLEVVQQQSDRAVEDLGRVAGRDRVAHEGLHAAQLVVGLARDRQLHSIPFGRERCDKRVQPRPISSSRGDAGRTTGCHESSTLESDIRRSAGPDRPYEVERCRRCRNQDAEGDPRREQRGAQTTVNRCNRRSTRRS